MHTSHWRTRASEPHQYSCKGGVKFNGSNSDSTCSMWIKGNDCQVANYMRKGLIIPVHCAIEIHDCVSLVRYIIRKLEILSFCHRGIKFVLFQGSF